MRVRPVAGKRGAAEHHIDAVRQRIGPVALPQGFQGAAGAVGAEHAGPAELQEPLVRIARGQVDDIEFALRIEPVMAGGNLLPEQPVGADDLLLDIACQRRVEHQKVIAIAVDTVEIALLPHGVFGKPGTHFLDEDPVAQRLRRLDFAARGCKPHFQGSDAAENLARRLVAWDRSEEWSGQRPMQLRFHG